MRYPEQPTFPIIGERYIEKYMNAEEYDNNYEDRYSKFSREQKFNENYVEEFGAFAILGNRDNNDDESRSQSGDDDSSVSVASPRRRDRRSIYYDQYNDNFDNESDEDFIVDPNPDRITTRRTVRRQPYNNENFVAQRNDRERRRQERNRRRGDLESNEDPDDYVMDCVVENEESEDASEESFIEEQITKKKPVVRNHNFASSRIEEAKDETSNEDEELIPNTKTKNTLYKGIFSSNRIVEEEEKESISNIRSFGHFLSRTNSEDYDIIPTITTDGYRIDIEEALKLKNEDKTIFDCALCKKKRGEFSLIGPFKYFIGERIMDEMVYWFHRECLERNDIVIQTNKYEFQNIQECVSEWILNEGEQ